MSNLNLKALEQKIEHFLLSPIPSIQAIYLFGSVSTKQSGPESDIDIAVLFLEKKEVNFNSSFLMKPILHFFNNDAGWYLSLDRTNWAFGKIEINILMLGIVWKGIAIPCMWILLPKKAIQTT